MDDFDLWNVEKKRLDNVDAIRSIKVREIWWVGVGKNVGMEINGKNVQFTRPVLIIKKLSKYSFVGVPLTSQEHHGSWYASFVFKDKVQYAALHQVRSYSVKRLHKRMGQIPQSDLDVVLGGLKDFYFK